METSSKQDHRLLLLFLIYTRLQDCPVDPIFKYLQGVRILAVWLGLPINTGFCLTKAVGLRSNLERLFISYILKLTEEETLVYWDLANEFLSTFNPKQKELSW